MLGSHPVLSGCQRGARGGAAPYPELLGWVVSMAAESSPLALSFNLLVHEAAAEEPQLSFSELEGTDNREPESCFCIAWSKCPERAPEFSQVFLV